MSLLQSIWAWWQYRKALAEIDRAMQKRMDPWTPYKCVLHSEPMPCWRCEVESEK